MAALRVVSSI